MSMFWIKRLRSAFMTRLSGTRNVAAPATRRAQYVLTDRLARL